MTPQRFERLKRVLRQRQPDLTVLTDGVHKSHNVSAILRTCDATGVRRMHAVSDSGLLARHHMIAGGSKRWVAVKTHDSIEAACARLKSEGFTLLLAHAGSDAVDFRENDYTRKTAIVLGAELLGPSAVALEQADASIAIPMHGMVESLNVSVAAAVILFEAQRQKIAAGHYDHCKIGEPEYSTTLFEWAHPNIARRCRERGLDYPPLSEDGDLLENPFAGAAPGGVQPSA